MSKKDVSIKLTSRQYDGENTEETELFSQGVFETTDYGYKISYEESEATGFAGSVTCLEVHGKKKVVMTRTGSFASNLIVELGTKHHCVYGTPYGTMMMGINGTKISSQMDENGGNLDFHYVLDINSSYIGDYDINIQVK